MTAPSSCPRGQDFLEASPRGAKRSDDLRRTAVTHPEAHLFKLRPTARGLTLQTFLEFKGRTLGSTIGRAWRRKSSRQPQEMSLPSTPRSQLASQPQDVRSEGACLRKRRTSSARGKHPHLHTLKGRRQECNAKRPPRTKCKRDDRVFLGEVGA